MFLSLLCNLGAIRDYSTGVLILVRCCSLLLFLCQDQRKNTKQNLSHQNCAQIAQNMQRQHHIEVSEVYFHIHGYLIVNILRNNKTLLSFKEDMFRHPWCHPQCCVVLFLKILTCFLLPRPFGYLIVFCKPK